MYLTKPRMKSLPLLTAALCLSVFSAWAANETPALALASYTVQVAGAPLASSVDAQIEAVRNATLSAQVQGAVIRLNVKVGDRVSAGQELVRIDARAAQQSAAASTAQVDAARTTEQVAAKDYQRQKQLFAQKYISQAALERAEAQWHASQSQSKSLQAQASASATQSGFYVVKAPYAGVVGQVDATLGDMAMPGKVLLTMYDPSQMRVTAYVGQEQAGLLRSAGASVKLQIEVPGLSADRITVPADQAQVLPTVNAQSHTVQVRVGLPADIVAAAPGMFARLWLSSEGGPKPDAAAGPLLVPVGTVVHRAELTGVYVLDADNRPLLRQVRLGRPAGDKVEVLSGVRAGDRVVLEPQAAARAR